MKMTINQAKNRCSSSFDYSRSTRATLSEAPQCLAPIENKSDYSMYIVGNIRYEETNKKEIRININLLVWLSFQVALHAGRFD